VAQRQFEVEGLIEACRAAVANGDGERAVRELVAEAVSDVGAVVAGLREREDAGPVTLYRDAGLTILDFAWAP
jgi:ornithine cyclodeaminase/alanine dehydrogenase-like protein (mu-crystallin family)